MPVGPHGRSNEPGRRGLGWLKDVERSRAEPTTPESWISMATLPCPPSPAVLTLSYSGTPTMGVRELCDAAAASGEFVDDESTEAGHSTSST